MQALGGPRCFLLHAGKGGARTPASVIGAYAARMGVWGAVNVNARRGVPLELCWDHWELGAVSPPFPLSLCSIAIFIF